MKIYINLLNIIKTEMEYLNKYDDIKFRLICGTVLGGLAAMVFGAYILVAYDYYNKKFGNNYKIASSQPINSLDDLKDL